jgi:hypothetical protein
MSADCQMSKVSLDFIFSHILRMTFVMEDDKAPNPTDVRLLSAYLITFQPNTVPGSIKQLCWWPFHNNSLIFGQLIDYNRLLNF